ncbi:MAG: T3SS effector HopA1 family protein [Nostoc sp. S4]|nr:T3SS effector HopA1 family protein [Nostoc sp. S4]
MLDQYLTKVEPKLLNILQDIANQVELQPNFRIYHPKYKLFELPKEVVANLQKMPLEIQQRYNCLQLRGFLYGIYYNGHLLNTLSLSDTRELPTDLENSTFLGIDREFLEQLHRHNAGNGYYDYGWSILQEKSDNSLIVSKGDLKLRVEQNCYLVSVNQSAVVDELVAILMPKNLIQKGFYLAVGNIGSHQQTVFIQSQITVRIYLNISPKGAIILMETLTQKLNFDSIPFILKFLYNPCDYKRYDAGVLYFDKSQYQVVRQIIKAAYIKHQAHFRAEVPLFTKKLMPGLGLAEQPINQSSISESFGENRCQIVANGLLEAMQKKDISADGKIQTICKQFVNANIDLYYPYLNAGSEDIYEF